MPFADVMGFSSAEKIKTKGFSHHWHRSLLAGKTVFTHVTLDDLIQHDHTACNHRPHQVIILTLSSFHLKFVFFIYTEVFIYSFLFFFILHIKIIKFLFYRSSLRNVGDFCNITLLKKSYLPLHQGQVRQLQGQHLKIDK